MPRQIRMLPLQLMAGAFALALSAVSLADPAGKPVEEAGNAVAAGRAARPFTGDWNQTSMDNAKDLYMEGQKTFRFDTFGNEAFWGGKLELHKAIAGSANGGVGAGLSPKAALAAGLKVDMDMVPPAVATGIKSGAVDLNDPKNTLALLKANAVVGVKGVFDSAGKLTSVGISCASCHSTVDDAFSPGIGHRLDGWPNRDLNIGAVIAMAPNLQPLADALKVDVPTVKKVVTAWGPGKYDAQLTNDGKGFTPDGKTAGTLLPPAYGLAGINLHTYTGWGSVPYWNIYVAHTQMHGSGSLYDDRLNDKKKFPLAAANKSGEPSGQPDLISGKLAGLHMYQLAIPAPKPAEGSFNATAAARGQVLFNGKAQCASCHVPPLYTEPGENLHTPAEIGIDSFLADRSPTGKYRTTPLRGVWSRAKGGYYHDGRFENLDAVVGHYDNHLDLKLTAAEKKDLVQFLLSL